MKETPVTPSILLSEPQTKLYKPNAIYIATFFGGPVAATYLLADNFRRLGEPEKAKRTWLIGLMATTVIFLLIFLLPKVPPHVIPLLCEGVAYLVLEKYQSKRLTEHETNGGKFFSGWRAAGVGLLICVLVFGPVFLYAIVSNPLFGTKEKSYKSDIIYYKGEAVSTPELDGIANGLTVAGYLGNSPGTEILVEKKDNVLQVDFPLVPGAWDNANVQVQFKTILLILQKTNPGRHFSIALCDDELEVHKLIK